MNQAPIAWKGARNFAESSLAYAYIRNARLDSTQGTTKVPLKPATSWGRKGRARPTRIQKEVDVTRNFIGRHWRRPRRRGKHSCFQAADTSGDVGGLRRWRTHLEPGVTPRPSCRCLGGRRYQRSLSHDRASSPRQYVQNAPTYKKTKRIRHEAARLRPTAKAPTRRRIRSELYKNRHQSVSACGEAGPASQLSSGRCCIHEDRTRTAGRQRAELCKFRPFLCISGRKNFLRSHIRMKSFNLHSN